MQHLFVGLGCFALVRSTAMSLSNEWNEDSFSHRIPVFPNPGFCSLYATTQFSAGEFRIRLPLSGAAAFLFCRFLNFRQNGCL
jgi:hypothetical protein